MKNKISIVILCLMIFVIAGCGGKSTTETSSSETKTMDNKTVKNDSDKTEKSTDSSLSPDKIDSSKPIPIGDLQAAVKANQTAWKGKEVSIIGKMLDPAVMTNAQTQKKLYSWRIAKPNSYSPLAMCMDTEKELPEDYKKDPENRVVKGTIDELSSIGDAIKLSNCEYVK